jgi:hypothetical protein
MKKTKLKIIEAPKSFFDKEMALDALMSNDLNLILGGECGKQYCAGGYCPSGYCATTYCSSQYWPD